MLRAFNLTYTYPQQTIPALDNVSFSIEKGSYTAVTGANGSGKSTLVRILCGLLTPDSGSVEILPEQHVPLVFQSPKDQIICGKVARDTAFGPQNTGLSSSEVELRTIESLSVTDMLDRAESSTMELSLGQTQKIALSGVIALRSDILILDEAVSMLDPDSREEIFLFLAYWNRCGHTIINITHDMDAVAEAHSVIVMEKGKIAFNGTKNAFFANQRMSAHVAGPALEKNRRLVSDNDTENALSFDHVSFSYGGRRVLSDIHFSLKRGTLTALTGISGSGKSTLLELASGLLVPAEGKVRSEYRPVLAQQNCESALFEQFAADDVAFGPRNCGMYGKQLVECVKDAMDVCSIPYEEFGERRTFTLSGGEKRRLACAGIIAMNAPVVLFDEPTAGLDGNTRYSVMHMLKSLADSGRTVLFSTHRRDEAEFADNELRIDNGRLTRTVAERNLEYATEMLPEQKALEGAKLLEKLRQASADSSGDQEKKTTFIGKLPPVVKYLLFFLLFVLSLAVRPLYLCGTLVVISFAYAVVSGYSWKRLAVSSLKVIPLLLFFCVFQMVFFPAVPGETVYVPYRWFTVTPSKIRLCITTLLHTEAALACINGFAHSTPEYDLIDGLAVLLKPLTFIRIPVKYIILIFEVMFRFIPLLVDEAAGIIKTQLVRGGLGKVKGGFAQIKALLPLFVPLVSQTVKRSEALADALTVRGFK